MLYTNDNNCKFDSFQDLGIQSIAQVASTQNSIFVLTTQGYVYGKGLNEFGELGLGHDNEVKDWKLLPLHNISDIACGVGSSYFLKNGKVYSCGLNDYGQLVNNDFNLMK